jgi:DNA-binding NarL/FixJ family response regulator
MKNPGTVRIVIIDDHPMVRAGLSLRIQAEKNLIVCGFAESEEEGLQVIKSSQPDLAIVDISLKNSNGIELTKQIKSHFPKVRVLVISGFQESLYAERALRAGAYGYVNKQESEEKIIEAIQTVANGERYVSAALAQRLMMQAVTGDSSDNTPAEKLTDRELEIFRLIGQGHATGEIAQQLYLSTRTIDSHRDNIKRKLAVKTAAELNRQAVQWVLENPEC